VQTAIHLPSPRTHRERQEHPLPTRSSPTWRAAPLASVCFNLSPCCLGGSNGTPLQHAPAGLPPATFSSETAGNLIELLTLLGAAASRHVAI
jgi:hypothetical protein